MSRLNRAADVLDCPTWPRLHPLASTPVFTSHTPKKKRYGFYRLARPACLCSFSTASFHTRSAMLRLALHHYHCYPTTSEEGFGSTSSAGRSFFGGGCQNSFIYPLSGTNTHTHLEYSLGRKCENNGSGWRVSKKKEIIFGSSADACGVIWSTHPPTAPPHALSHRPDWSTSKSPHPRPECRMPNGEREFRNTALNANCICESKWMCGTCGVERAKTRHGVWLSNWVEEKVWNLFRA